MKDDLMLESLEFRIRNNLSSIHQLKDRIRQEPDQSKNLLLEILTLMGKVKRDIDLLKTQQVHQARNQGYSWQVIADQLGMSKQGAWEKYHKRLGVK